MVHLDASGAVVGASLWTVQDDGGLSPSAITRTGSGAELVLVGDARNAASGDGMFVARLDDAGGLRSSHGYVACETAFNLSPTAVIAAESGGITVAGGSHAQRRAFVARIHENGEVGFVRHPGLAGGNSPLFVASDLAELPTSGFVMAASTVELTGDGAAAVPALALVGLDAGGRPMWLKRYAPDARRAASFGALRLTPDGGVTVTALVAADDGAGSLWTMKAYAKDGDLGEAPVSTSTFALDDEPSCGLRRFELAPRVTELAVVAETKPVRVERR